MTLAISDKGDKQRIHIGNTYTHSVAESIHSNTHMSITKTNTYTQIYIPHYHKKQHSFFCDKRYYLTF
jgi:hypothetical protein